MRKSSGAEGAATLLLGIGASASLKEPQTLILSIIRVRARFSVYDNVLWIKPAKKFHFYDDRPPDYHLFIRSKLSYDFIIVYALLN